MPRVFVQYILCLLIVVPLFGCKGEDKPRSLEEINAERLTLPALYRTKSGHDVVAAGNIGLFVDEETNELAWPVYECTNPNCPGRSETGEAHLFIWIDPQYFVTEEGTVGTRNFKTAQEWRDAVDNAGGTREPTCEHCLTIRNKSSESLDEQLKYSLYPQAHVLPSTLERRKELDAEHQERKAYINRRMGLEEEE